MYSLDTLDNSGIIGVLVGKIYLFRVSFPSITLRDTFRYPRDTLDIGEIGMTVKVLSSIMGSGKTSNIFRYMRDNPDNNYLFISVFLDEVGDGNSGREGRIQKKLPEMAFKMPKSRGDGKVGGLKKLLQHNCNIATTHTLLGMFDSDVIDLLVKKEYHIIIDEAVDCIQIYDKLTRSDVESLLKSGQISVDDENKVTWNAKDYDFSDTRYSDVRELADSGMLYMYGEHTLVSEYSPRLLKECKEVMILSYLFEGSSMSCWLKAHGIGYDSIDPVAFGLEDENVIKAKIRENLTLIHNRQLHKDKGYRDAAFSSTWWKNANYGQRQDVKRYMESSIKTHGAKKGEIFWTVFKDRRNGLAGRGYSQGILQHDDEGELLKDSDGQPVKIDPFLSYNIKATNKYVDFNFAMYMVNVYKHPDEIGYLKSRGVDFDAEKYALSTCIQWLWRGAIRAGNPMKALIASKRMKGLVESWLNSDERGL